MATDLIKVHTITLVATLLLQSFLPIHEEDALLSKLDSCLAGRPRGVTQNHSHLTWKQRTKSLLLAELTVWKDYAYSAPIAYKSAKHPSKP